jgi:hypothetical protein
MEVNSIASLADQLHKLFGSTAEEREKARGRLKEHPAEALKEIGFKVDTEIIEGFKGLNDKDKEQIIERFERVSRYNTDFRENHSERMKLLKELGAVFEAFLQWEEPLEEERAAW